jgi:DNA gyrase/topoisomerase IV subunit A
MQEVLILVALGWIVLNVFVPLLIPLTVAGVFVYYFWIEPSTPPSSLRKQEKLLKKHLEECGRILREDSTRFDLVRRERLALAEKLQLSQRMATFLKAHTADDSSMNEFVFTSDNSECVLRTFMEETGSRRSSGIEVFNHTAGESVYRAISLRGGFQSPEVFLAGNWLYAIIRAMKPHEEHAEFLTRAAKEKEKQDHLAAKREEARKKFG